MWGIVPAAGSGTRIQPLAFSKELLPVGSRRENGAERPRAVSEYLVERMTRAGADRICFVISPTKSDILRYYGSRFGPAHMVYAVQPEPRGLCDAIFRAVPLIAPTETVVIGLPDTIWFPEDGLVRPAGGSAGLPAVPGGPSRAVRCGGHRVRRARPRGPGQAAAPGVVLDLGRVQAARSGPARSAPAVVRARSTGRVSRHAAQRLYRGAAERLTACAPERRTSMSAR